MNKKYNKKSCNRIVLNDIFLKVNRWRGEVDEEIDRFLGWLFILKHSRIVNQKLPMLSELIVDQKHVYQREVICFRYSIGCAIVIKVCCMILSTHVHRSFITLFVTSINTNDIIDIVLSFHSILLF